MLTEDVTIEVFNHCAGSCTGCMLSIVERRAVKPVMTEDAFALATARLADHGRRHGTRYRLILSFGDVIWLPVDVQERYYGIAARAGHQLAATMTLVEPEQTERYRAGLRALLAHDDEAVFDITIDPVRMERAPDYVGRLREAIALAPELHLQVLLSEAVFDRYAPEALSDLLTGALGEQPVALGFTPTLVNLERRNYRYAVTSATDYARRFYASTAAGRRHLESELDRFRAAGSWDAFARTCVHIGPDLAIYPVAYTMFGDVIMDVRNHGQALGSLAAQDLEAIVSSATIARLNAQNNVWMLRGTFGCTDCSHNAACTFNGVGLARRLYREHESKVGSCYGPVEFMSAPGVLAAAE